MLKGMLSFLLITFSYVCIVIGFSFLHHFSVSFSVLITFVSILKAYKCIGEIEKKYGGKMAAIRKI